MERAVHEARVQVLNDADPARSGDYVLYWMQQSQRERFNHALEYAVQCANEHKKPLVVGFALTPDDPDLRRHQWRFVVQGLRDVREALVERGIQFVVRTGSPVRVACDLAKQALVTVCDRGYLRHQRTQRRRLAREVPHRVVQVESDAIVPVDAASTRAEYAARTLRPKIQGLLSHFVEDLPASASKHCALHLDLGGVCLDQLQASVPDARDFPDEVIDGLDVDLQGGEREARRRLARFVAERLPGYESRRADPLAESTSGLSPYLHFGQISPLEVLRAVRAQPDAPGESKDDFLEQLVVRRELAMNFVQFTDDYDTFAALPEWARETLDEHAADEREHAYTRRELCESLTHDATWNAAMLQMRHTGWLHNHLRMYWGKKLIEWTNTPRFAYRVALDLNNACFLDGRDPDSYANVGWLFGLHDRAWGERSVYGHVRSMSAGGLDRKFDVDAYVARVQERFGVPEVH